MLIKLSYDVYATMQIFSWKEIGNMQQKLKTEDYIFDLNNKFCILVRLNICQEWSYEGHL